MTTVGLTMTTVGLTMTTVGLTMTPVGVTVTPVGATMTTIGATMTTVGLTMTTIGAAMTAVGDVLPGGGGTICAGIAGAGMGGGKGGRHVGVPHRGPRTLLLGPGQGMTMLATAPVIQQASAPATMARRPMAANSLRRSGARALRPPIWMAMEGKLANPHRA